MAGDLPPPTGESGRPVYNVPFAWDSSHGHIVELLVDHIEPGLIVDIGCGYAPHAERLQQRGFDYVGVDADPDSVTHLRERGFAAEIADANDSEALLDALSSVTPTDATIAAVLALDVLEHLVSPHHTLGEIGQWMRSRDATTFGVSLPNITHDDVVLKLMTGRFDMTPSGLLDHTHLRFFTDASVTAMMSSAGMTERERHDVHSPKTDQEWPEVHPTLSDGALLGAFLRRARALADRHGQTFQFVRLFQLDAAPAAEPTLLAKRTEVPRPAITVLASHEATDDQFDALTASMSAQRDGSVELVRLRAADDGRGIIDSIGTSYVSIVRGGEQFSENWAAQLLALADRYPAAVLRTGPLSDGEVDVEHHDVAWNPSFALFEHYLEEGSPDGALAFPVAFLRELSVLWPEDVATIDVHALLMEATGICGVVDTGTAGVAPPVGWRRGSDACEHSLERLAAGPLLMPFGAAAEVAKILGQLRSSDRRSAELAVESDALRQQIEQLTRELDRPPVKLARGATSVVDRIRRR